MCFVQYRYWYHRSLLPLYTRVAVVTALNKAWCQHHFACNLCDVKMTQKTKFYEFDQKPVSMQSAALLNININV